MEGNTMAERLILQWNSISGVEENADQMIFDGHHRAQAERYIRAVEEIRRTVGRQYSSSSSNTATVLQLAMARLEEEFSSILVNRVRDLESDFLQSDFNSLSMSSFSLSNKFNFSIDDAAVGSGSSTRRNSLELATEAEEEEEEGKFAEEEEGSGDGSGISCHRTSSSIFEVDLVSSDVLTDLRSIAEQMILAGYAAECFQAYSVVRTDVVDQYLNLLGVEKLSITEVHSLPWEIVNVKIIRWNHAAKMCVGVVFSSEKRLCDLIFDGLGDDDYNGRGSTSDVVFAETIKGAAFQLLGFAEAISIGQRAPDRLFKIVDLHETLRDLIPDLKNVFHGSSMSIITQAEEILSQLAEAVQSIIADFPSMIYRASAKQPVPGGNRHPMVRYVVNYLGLIPDYKTALSSIIVHNPLLNGDIVDVEITIDENRLPLAAHLQWMLAVLVSTLDDKANLYKDPALSQLFMMNNLYYIVDKVKQSSELRDMIGDDYLKKLTGKYRLAAMAYQRSTLVKVLDCLKDDGINVHGSFSSSGVSKTALRERFKSFNAAFDETHRTQASWTVPDARLKEELKISISQRLLPAYGSFYGKYHLHIENGKHPELYIKYTVEDLERAVEDFFEGRLERGVSSSSSSSSSITTSHSNSWFSIGRHSRHS